MRYEHRTCTILQHYSKLLKFSTLELKKTWQGTVPETSAKVMVRYRTRNLGSSYGEVPYQKPRLKLW